MKQLEKDRIISTIPVPGGKMMYIYGEGPLTSCDIIKFHHEISKDDPECLTTKFIQNLVGRKCMDEDDEEDRKKRPSKSIRRKPKKVVKKCKCTCK